MPLGLIGGIALFVFIWIFLVIFAASKPKGLVSPDYYSQEMQHQQRIESRQRSENLTDKVELEINDAKRSAVIHFPNEFQPEKISGTIELFRPSDTKLDINIPISVSDSRSQNIDISTIKSGFWRIKINWQLDSTNFYDEFSFIK